jgi:hypothetical protein
MATAAYRYQSDDGNVYQVVLPTDFALPLNYIAASGSEPYLPNFISMRYATYQDVLGLYINPAYILSPFGPVNPPPACTVDGVNYSLVSSYGEVRGSFNLGNIVLIAGPQGPPGSGGSGAVSSVSAGSGISVSPTTGNVVVTNNGVTSLAAGSGISVSGSTGLVTITNTGSSSFAPNFSSGGQTITLSHLYNIAHGLGRNPYFMRAYIVCTTADNGYSVGEQIQWAEGQDISSTMYNGTAGCNSTDVFLAMGAEGLLFTNKSSFGPVLLTIASWQLHLDAW